MKSPADRPPAMRRALAMWACLCALAAALAAQGAHATQDTHATHSTQDVVRWQTRAAHVSIIRDEWGIAHVYGDTDADAVFGAIYAQAEDDFGRIERNYLQALGWLAQADGEKAVYRDLRQRLFVDTRRLQRDFDASPPWLKTLLMAWADGLNYFLNKHAAASPRVIRRFEPWMALSFTEGSIGGDIETIALEPLQSLYDSRAPLAANPQPATQEPGGSNGFAVAPSRSASGHALLWINPHTSYYFRSELHMVSGEGLGVYGAATWGQFFIYQGFNARNGWMHTSYGGDAVDEYLETTLDRSGSRYYRYGDAIRKLQSERIRIAYRDGEHIQHRDFTVLRTHHGPIVRQDGGRLVAVKLLEEPVRALEQSFLRTKTRDYASFRKIQDMRTDTSNNTVYADGDGTIAYFHGNFIPRRDVRFDYSHPVDGSDPATEWRGPHALDEMITLENPASGWIQNTNNWPFSAAGDASPHREDFPRYMWSKGENPRGLHAVEVLRDLHAVTLDGLIATGYDPHLTAFDSLLPPLFEAFDRASGEPADLRRLREPIAALRRWDRRSAVTSVATTVAIYWGQELIKSRSQAASAAEVPVIEYLVNHPDAQESLHALGAALDRLQRDFGYWEVPWGDVNRFQRRTDEVVQPFDDSAPSLPVGFASSTWGSLASIDFADPRPTKKNYGSTGNSFVAAVEFAPTVRAKAIMTGGESGDPASVHFLDQAERFVQGRLREVHFTREDVLAHAVRTYHP